MIVSLAEMALEFPVALEFSVALEFPVAQSAATATGFGVFCGFGVPCGAIGRHRLVAVVQFVVIGSSFFSQPFTRGSDELGSDSGTGYLDRLQ